MNVRFLAGAVLPCVVLLLFSCSDTPDRNTEPVDKYDSMECLKLSSTDIIHAIDRSDRNYDGIYTFKLTGLVEVNGAGETYIVVNPDSKSRKSYLVTGKLKSVVAAMKDEVVRVKCCYLEKRMWSGIVRVYEILQ